MSYVIYLLTTSRGAGTPFDFQYLKHYDPSFVASKGYDGGKLEVTPLLKEAQVFESIGEAHALYTASYGTRPDGRPNRPLTAWSVVILAAQDAEQLVPGYRAMMRARENHDAH